MGGGGVEGRSGVGRDGGGGVILPRDDHPADMVNGDWFLTRTACVNPALALRQACSAIIAIPKTFRFGEVSVCVWGGGGGGRPSDLLTISATWRSVHAI